jgi:hypothetical protein
MDRYVLLKTIPTLKCILSSLNIYCFAETINLLLIIIPGKDIALLFDGASNINKLVSLSDIRVVSLLQIYPF